MGSAGNFLVAEISVSTFVNSSKSKFHRKINNLVMIIIIKRKKGNIITINIINILRLLICYSMVLAL
jgi:hypothetical protein